MTLNSTLRTADITLPANRTTTPSNIRNDTIDRLEVNLDDLNTAVRTTIVSHSQELALFARKKAVSL